MSEVLSLFDKKHTPSVVSRVLRVRYTRDIQHTDLSNVWAVMETAGQIVHDADLNKLAPAAVVLYPGRHPESRHDLEVLERNRTALYRLEDSPWNKAVCDYVHTQLERMKTQAEIRGNGNSNGAVDAKPTKQIVIGVIGAGNIGSRVAQRAAIEGKRVFYLSLSLPRKFNSA
jgi:hypothetical protein